MEPMSKPRYNEIAALPEKVAAAEAPLRTRRIEPPVPPAFAPGALDILRERVARMRETIAEETRAQAAEMNRVAIRDAQAQDAVAPQLSAEVPTAFASPPELPAEPRAAQAKPAEPEIAPVAVEPNRVVSLQPILVDAPFNISPWLPTDIAVAYISPEAEPVLEIAEAPHLTAELAAIRATLQRFEGAEHSVLLAEAVGALGRKIDLLNAKALDPVSLRRLELQVAELRGTVDRVFQGATGPALALEPLAQATQDIRAVVRATAQGQERSEREVVALNARLQGLTRQIGTLPEDIAGALSDQLAELVESSTAASGVDAAALDPLVDVIERHLVALTERVVASNRRLDRLDSIEEALHRLSSQMEDLQHASADVSAEAVQAVALRLSARDDAPAVVGLKRGLAALEARQQDFELRTEDFMIREVELQLQDLADIEVAPSRRSREAAARFSNAFVVRPAFNLDQRIFETALGDDEVIHERTVRTDWVAAAARAEQREKGARKVRRKGHLVFAGRAAVVAAAVGLAGVTILQIARPSESFARPELGSAQTTAKAASGAPVQALELAKLPAPVGTNALRTAALSGDPAAAYEVGARFADGRGTEASAANAIKWLSYAAARGSVPAAYRLGAVYEFSERNPAEARRLYTWAAERGNVLAMHNLGVMSTGDADGRSDWPAALKWFRQAAEAGLKDSQHNLGVIYARGFAGQADQTEAFKWFSVAAAQGDAASARKRDEVARKLDDASLNRARSTVTSFAPTSIDKTANAVTTKPEWDTAAEASVQRTSSGT